MTTSECAFKRTGSAKIGVKDTVAFEACATHPRADHVGHVVVARKRHSQTL